MTRRLEIVLLLVIGVAEIEMLPEAFKQMATNFLKEMENCKAELGIKDSILSEFYRLWKEDYDGVTRDTGCILNCLSKKLDIFDVDGKFHHGNAKEFAVRNGADDHVATEIVSLVHNCEKDAGEISDECVRTLELTKCVRSNITQVKWTPKVEVEVGQVIAQD